MTTLMRQTHEVDEHYVMPGWDIVGDLTPPELLDRRLLLVLRRRIIALLLLVTLLCAAAYAYTIVLHRQAQSEVDTADAQTVSLRRTANQYAGITRIETTLRAMSSQQAALLAGDVDVPRTVASVRRSLPASMSIDDVSVTVTGSTDDSTPAGGSSQSGLDASGRPAIGTVTVTGTGRSLDDLPAFVDRLARVRGFVDVLPTSNQVDKATSQYNVTIVLTDLLRTHRYDVKGGDQ